MAEVPGPFNSTTSVSGTTGEDPDYLISVLSDAYGVTGDAPFFQIDTPTVINGVTIPAGTYIKQAFIADATIARAKIQDLAVDNAKIADLNANKITAGSMQVGSYIQSSNFVTGVQGWKIDSSGNVEFGNGTFRGTLSNAGGTFGGALVAASGTFSGSLSAASGTFTGSLSAASGTFTGQLRVGSGGTPGGYQIEITAANVLWVDDFYGASILGKDMTLLNSVSYPIITATNTSSSGSAHALRARNTNASYGSSGLVGPARADFDFYAEGHGAYGPFTGSHDGLILKTVSPSAGDILVDGDVLFRRGVSYATSEVFLSSTTNQVAIGIYVTRHEITDGFYIASAIVGKDDRGNPIPSEAFTAMAETHDVCGVNSVGEGLINVCGENGNISKGDLIVTSSLAGKGMKQSDDIVRAVTVAKACLLYTSPSPRD